MLILRRRKKREDESWKKDGKEKFEKFNKTFHDFSRHLRPFHYKRECMAVLLETERKISSVQESTVRKNVWTVSRRLLEVINPITDWGRHKSSLFRRQFSLMKWLRPFDEMNTVTEVGFLSIVERSYYKRVPVRASSLMRLRMEVQNLQDATHRMDVITQNIAACEYVPNCDSILHKRTAGCPKCGVVHMGGQSNQVQYVKSIDKTSGVPTLVRLEFELDNLRQEEVLQRAVVSERREIMEQVRHQVFMTLLVNFQAWFAVRLALRQCRKVEDQIHKSLYYFRIRRLVRMKREVDSILVSELDVVQLSMRYSEFVLELEEYVAIKRKRLDAIIIKVARHLLTTLRTLVLKTRRRKQKQADLEQTLRRMVEGDVEKRQREKAVRQMRKRVEAMEKRKWVCVRAECLNRKFLSEDRFTTHMNIHYQDDIRKANEASTATENLATQADLKFEQRQSKAQEFDKALVRMQEVHAALDCHKVGWISEQQSFSRTDFAVAAEESALPHIRFIAPPTVPVFHLELLSRSELISLSTGTRILLDQPLVRVGTEQSCEVAVTIASHSNTKASLPAPVSQSNSSISMARSASDSILPDTTSPAMSHSSHIPVLSRVHCMLFCALAGDTAADGAQVTVVDNNTRSGTYVISSKANGMAVKVPMKASAGLALHPGDLLCIGVNSIASKSKTVHYSLPLVLTAVEASSASIVFRVRCIDLEKLH